MRNLASLIAGFGIGFLFAREYDRMLSEKARLMAFEQQAAGVAAGAPGGPAIGRPPEPPHPDQLEERELFCDLCSTEFTEKMPPGEMTAECPNCHNPVDVR